MAGAARGRVRLIVVDTNLLDVDMHNFNFARGVARDGRRFGLAPRIVVPKRAPASLVQALHARAVLSFSAADTLMQDRLSWRIAETVDGGALLAADLAALDGSAAIADSVVLLPTASSREILALALALERIAPPRAIVMGFHSLRTGDPDRRPTNQVLGLLRYAMNRLRRVFPPERILVHATTGLLAKDMADLLRHQVRVCPHPIWYDLAAPVLDAEAPPPDGRTTFAVLGGNRLDKGSDMVAGIAREGVGLADRARLLVQLLPRLREPAGTSIADALAGNPLVAIRRGVMPESAMLHHCATADAVLLPYDPAEYRDRASGIFAMAVAMGRPVIAPAGTWMAERLQAGEATGIVVQVHAAFAYVAAMRRFLVEPARFQAAAAQRAAPWRARESGLRYLEAMVRDLDRAGLWTGPQMSSSG
ncbi:hypothetical protein [Stella sp.]|uniref:hypothetical protein n=1 Tax=Stella sp. TaxID=2912054 RepID=UPI0035B47C5D